MPTKKHKMTPSDVARINRATAKPLPKHLARVRYKAQKQGAAYAVMIDTGEGFFNFGRHGAKTKAKALAIGKKTVEGATIGEISKTPGLLISSKGGLKPNPGLTVRNTRTTWRRVRK